MMKSLKLTGGCEAEPKAVPDLERRPFGPFRCVAAGYGSGCAWEIHGISNMIAGYQGRSSCALTCLRPMQN
jgi:hypothetical protein